MSPAEIESLALEAYTAYNERELERAASCYSEGVRLRSAASGEVLEGRSGYLQLAGRWVAAFPDSRLEVVRVEVSPGAATVELVRRGTHTGTLLGSHGHIPPTWAQVELPVCEVLRMEDGLIRSADIYLDTGDLLRQMGLLPSSPLHAPDRRASLELYAVEPDAAPERRNTAVVRQFVDRVLNRHDPSAASEMCMSNLAWHGGPMGELPDLARYQRHLRGLFAAFPDLEIELVDSVAEGDRVAVRATLSGTHWGTFHGVPPTGKHVVHSGASVFRVVDGRIAEEWWHYDLFSILHQLYALPAPRSASRR